MTPRGIDPGNSRLVAQCLNNYATIGTKAAHNMTIKKKQSDSSQFTVSLHTEKKKLTFIVTFNPVTHPQSHHKSCVTHAVSSQILCYTHSLITNRVSHPQSHHKSCVTPTASSQILCHTHSLITNTLKLAELTSKYVCFMEMDTVIRSIIYKLTTKRTAMFMIYFIHSVLTNMFRVILILQDYKGTNVVLCRCHSFTTTNY